MTASASKTMLSPKTEFSPRTALSAASLITILLTIYLPRLAAAPRSSDGGEIATAAIVGGLIHPPGYPIYATIASFLAQFSPTQGYLRLAYFSAFTQCFAALGLFLYLRRVLRGELLPFIFTLSWALALPTLLTGVDVELFALHNLLVVALLHIALSFWRGPPRSPLAAFAIGAAFGIGASHHHLIVLWFPVVAAAIWHIVPSKDRFIQYAALAFGGALLGLAPYGMLFHRYQQAPWLVPDPLSSWIDLLVYFLRIRYGTFSIGAELTPNAEPLLAPTMALFLQWTPLFVVLGLAFLIIAIVKPTAFRLAVAAVLLLHGWFLWQSIVPPDTLTTLWSLRFLSIVGLILTIAAAHALEGLRLSSLHQAIIALLVGGPLLMALPSALSQADLSHDNAISDRSTQLLRDAAKDAIVVAPEDDEISFALSYFRYGLGLRNDTVVLLPSYWSSPRYRNSIGQMIRPAYSPDESLPSFIEVMCREGRPVVEAEQGDACREKVASDAATSSLHDSPVPSDEKQ